MTTEYEIKGINPRGEINYPELRNSKWNSLESRSPTRPAHNDDHKTRVGTLSNRKDTLRYFLLNQWNVGCPGTSSYALELVSHWSCPPAPTIRMALWYWRVSLAAPDAPAVTRFGIAELLASAEIIKKYPDKYPDKLTRDKMQEVNPKVMLFLSFTPWRSPSHEARYWKAALSAGYEPYPIDFASDLFKRIDEPGELVN